VGGPAIRHKKQNAQGRTEKGKCYQVSAKPVLATPQARKGKGHDEQYYDDAREKKINAVSDVCYRDKEKKNEKQGQGSQRDIRQLAAKPEIKILVRSSRNEKIKQTIHFFYTPVSTSIER
jgi:hypothetical protein